MKYYNYSGGAKGSDIFWDIIGKEYGVKTLAFSFSGHKCLSSNYKILSDEELQEGWENVLLVANKMNRYLGKTGVYVRNLLSRNWFQVKYSNSIYAIGTILKPGEKGKNYRNSTNLPVIDGGTGYAVGMAINIGKPVYVFDQNLNKWFIWNNNNFMDINNPVLTNRFAGIGTRELNENGKNAIKSIYNRTFKEL